MHRLGRIKDHRARKALKSRSELTSGHEPVDQQYEPYQQPPSTWDKVQSFAFAVMLCLAVPLALSVVLSVVANGTRIDGPVLLTIQIILAVGTFLSFIVAYLDILLEGEN
jgi:hypothetical protein